MSLPSQSLSQFRGWADFFQEIGRPIAADTLPKPPSLADIQGFTDVAARYHHWLASPEENAAVGINLSG